MVCRSRLLGGSGSQNQMLGGGMLEGQPEMDAGERIKSGCSSQKWMPRETKDRVQGRTVKTNKKRIGSDSSIFWATHLVRTT